MLQLRMAISFVVRTTAMAGFLICSVYCVKTATAATRGKPLPHAHGLPCTNVAEKAIEGNSTVSLYMRGVSLFVYSIGSCPATVGERVARPRMSSYVGVLLRSASRDFLLRYYSVCNLS
jgi:hypothetical protein